MAHDDLLPFLTSYRRARGRALDGSVDIHEMEEHLTHVVDVMESVQARVPDRDAFATAQGDPFALGGLVCRLETAIEAMIDVAFQLSAKAFKHAPENSVQAFATLERGGVIPKEQVPNLRRMVKVPQSERARVSATR